MLAAEQFLSAPQLRRIDTVERAARPRTLVLELEGAWVVVKWQRRRRFALAYQMLDLLARIGRQECLRGVPLPGGAAGQALEVERMRELGRCGVSVPQILHEASDYFVMSHASGPDLASHLPRDALALRERWNLGLRFVRDVHAAGQYLSQAFARNLIVTDQGIVAIDFEDDPRSVMNLEAAQTRDWLAYLLSTMWMLPRHESWCLADLREFLEQEAPAIRYGLWEAARRWAWLRALPESRRIWGRDLVSVQALAVMLERFARDGAGGE